MPACPASCPVEALAGSEALKAKKGHLLALRPVPRSFSVGGSLEGEEGAPCTEGF